MTEQQFPPLEEECGFCDPPGSGHDDLGDTCLQCGGTGATPTEFGWAVLRLLSHRERRKQKREENGWEE